VREGKFSGLRIDHVDGLYDPLSYLQRLRREAGDIYLVVEKILAFEEELPGQWPVEGTTGYDFLNFVGGNFLRAPPAAQIQPNLQPLRRNGLALFGDDDRKEAIDYRQVYGR
jgi:maltooligosyltrehalose synthase